MASTAGSSTASTPSPTRKVEHHYVDHANDTEMTFNNNSDRNVTEEDAQSDHGSCSTSSNKKTATTTSAATSTSTANGTGIGADKKVAVIAVPHPIASSSSDRNFPVKLHFMLNELQLDGCDHIISWQPHGRCFVVHKQSVFVKSILPMWFRQSKFASFQRQLNLYGFKRLTSGRDKGGYYHELFLRGKSFLAHKIPRTKLKNDGARKSTSPETEPNFYSLPFLPEEERKADSSKTQRMMLNGTGNKTSNGVATVGLHNDKMSLSSTSNSGKTGLIPNYRLPTNVLSSTTLVSELLMGNQNHQHQRPDPVTSCIQSILSGSGGSNGIKNLSNMSSSNAAINSNLLTLAQLEQSLNSNLYQQQQQSMNNRSVSDPLHRTLELYSRLLSQPQEQPSAANAGPTQPTPSTTTSSSADITSSRATNTDLLAQLVYQELLSNQRTSVPTYGRNSGNNNALESIAAAISAARTSSASAAALQAAFTPAVEQSPLQQLLQHHQQKRLQEQQQQERLALLQQQQIPVPNSVLSSSSSILEAARVALIQGQRNDQMNATVRGNSSLNLNTNRSPININDVLALRLALSSGQTSVDQLLRSAAMGQPNNHPNNSGNTATTTYCTSTNDVNTTTSETGESSNSSKTQ